MEITAMSLSGFIVSYNAMCKSIQIHIGKRIKEVFDAQPKTHNVEWLAQELHCGRANIYNIFLRKNIDVELLARISIVLEYDFFKELSSCLISECGVDHV